VKWETRSCRQGIYYPRRQNEQSREEVRFKWEAGPEVTRNFITLGGQQGQVQTTENPALGKDVLRLGAPQVRDTSGQFRNQQPAVGASTASFRTAVIRTLMETDPRALGWLQG
jgi:hypothetical protein